ncbi:MAG: substrate-binding domain-containing protein, partial [Anaerolineales bacterium]|nr:substrate-binding domain-containing protein [Anaerolineales bacterium]
YSCRSRLWQFIGYWLCLCLLIACSISCSAPSQTPHTLILATTTSLQDTGLLDALISQFEKQSQLTVKTIAVGSGQALQLGKQGDADVLLTHDPRAEIAFMEAGYGAERLAVMANHFVLVGPAHDPAQVRGYPIPTALQKIAHSRSLFLSRGDQSGTHKIEQELWQKAGFTPYQESWYLESGQGMAVTLFIASEKGAYTLTDRATFLVMRRHLDLNLLVEGDADLRNVYHVITVNSKRFPQVNAKGARAFAQFLTSPQIQDFIRRFGQTEYGEPLYIPAVEP